MAEKIKNAVAARSRRRVWPLVFLAVLAAVSLLLHAVKWHRRVEVQGRFDQCATLAAARPIEGTKALRARFYEIQYYLGYPTAAAYAVADFVRRLGTVFRPRKILALQIDADMQHFDFELTVAIDTGAPGGVPWKFAGLYEELWNFPDVSDLSFKEKGPADKNHSRMFTITGSVELP
jgi:hypothetical protein